MKKIFLFMSLSAYNFMFSQNRTSATDNYPIPSAPAKNEDGFVKVSDAPNLKRILSGKLDTEKMALQPDKEAVCSEGNIYIGSKIVKDLNVSKLKDSTGPLKSTVYYEINEQGKINGFVIDGNNKIFNEELEKGVRKNLKEKCTPAVINRKLVKSLVTVPVKFVL